MASDAILSDLGMLAASVTLLFALLRLALERLAGMEAGWAAVLVVTCALGTAAVEVSRVVLYGTPVAGVLAFLWLFIAMVWAVVSHMRRNGRDRR